MTLGELILRLGFDVDESTVRDVNNTIKGIKNTANKLLGVIGIGFTVSGLGELAQKAADAKATVSQFSQVFKELEGQANESLEGIAEDTGIVSNRLKGSYTQIAAFAKTTGMETDQALDLTNRAMKAVADSAAFYDRSLEDVTESLQSFLKGNFENDSALGLSCTETTRNAAANEVYGKSFKDLGETQKQLILLKMVEDANEFSGAVGQAARESDTWSNQLGNLNQSITDLKAAVGETFLQPAIGGLKWLSSIVQGITKQVPNVVNGFGNLADEMFGVTNEENNLFRGLKNIFSTVKVLKPEVDRMMQTLANGASKAAGFIHRVLDRLGGIENVLKLLTIIASSFFIVMNWGKILSGAKTFVSMLKSIGKMFSMANLKVLAVVAGIVLLMLAVEDLINFLSGNDSVIGTIFDNAGIGADNARESIITAFSKVKSFFTNTWQELKAMVGKYGASISKSVSKIFGGIATILGAIFKTIVEIGTIAFAGLGNVFGNIDLSTPIAFIVSTIDGLIGILGEVGEFISNHVGLVEGLVKAYAVFKIGSVIKQFAKFTVTLIKQAAQLAKLAAGFGVSASAKIVDTMAQGAMTAATLAWNAAATVASVVTTAFGTAISFLTSPIGIAIVAITALIAIGVLLYKNWESIKEFASTIWTAIVTVFQTEVENMKTLFSGFSEFLSTTFSNILAGISEKIGSIKETIVNGIMQAVEFIKALPSQAVEWGLDFINGLRNGILSGVQGIVDAVKGVGERIRSFLHFSVPDEGPLTDYESWMPDFMSGLASGIGANEDMVMDKVRNLASGISALVQGATASISTVASGAVSNTNTTNVTQHNTFSNNYYGNERQVQQNISRGMNKSAQDATTYLAKGLAYAR